MAWLQKNEDKPRSYPRGRPVTRGNTAGNINGFIIGNMGLTRETAEDDIGYA